MHRYKELDVWKKSMDMAQKIYELTANFPGEEKFGLVSQMRRSAVSVASNIAEGVGRNSKGEFKQFLGISQGSAFELETQILLTERIQFIKSSELELLLNQLTAIQNMIYKLQSSLK